MSHFNNNLAFLTVEEVSILLRLSTLTIYKYIKEGKISVLNLGGHYRISKAALDEFITKHIVEGREENEK